MKLNIDPITSSLLTMDELIRYGYLDDSPKIVNHINELQEDFDLESVTLSERIEECETETYEASNKLDDIIKVLKDEDVEIDRDDLIKKLNRISKDLGYL